MIKLLDIINELEVNRQPSKDIKEYLLGMLDSFGEGNDNEYKIGEEVEFEYEGEEYGDIDNYDDAPLFIKSLNFLKQNSPTIINDTIDYTFTTNGKDIIVKWIEPDWDEINNGEINELTIEDPKRYSLTQKGIDVINDVNTLEKLLEKYDFSLRELQDSEEWVISDILNSWYGFDPSLNKIRLSKDEITQNLEKMDPDPDIMEDMLENIENYEGYVEFK